MQTIPPGAAQRITATLFVTQSFASAALIANATVNSIIGATLSGNAALAGLPGTLLLLGAAGASYPAGWLMQHVGRRLGLALGFLVGFLGMLTSGVAVALHTFPLFLVGLTLIGASRGAIDQSRYAAADAQPPERRGKAISTVVLAGTVGAIGGPALVGPVSDFVAGFGLDPLGGPMLSGALLFALAGVLIVLFLRPDPRDIARALAALPAAVNDTRESRAFGAILRVPAVQLAVVALIFGQAIMVMIMSLVPLHMHNHNHGLGDVSLVIVAHTLGMFGLSSVTGYGVDRWGNKTVITLGALLLISGALIAPVSLWTPWIALALFLVGVGWNLCYIAGSSLLSGALVASERPSVQGASDLAVNLSSAAASLGSGVLMASSSFGTLCILGAVFALVPLGVLALQDVRRTRVAASTS